MHSAARVVALAFVAALAGCESMSNPAQQTPDPGHRTAAVESVHAYIIDTGIWTLQPEFGGRANNVFDAYHATGEDCNGHGTHVAGTIGAATFGVAKAVSLHGVRVLSCAGIGLNSDVIAGVDWVSANHVN